MYVKNVTGLTVCYQTKGLLQQAVNSIRQFYPHFNILIIDGSPVGSDTWNHVCDMKDDHTAVVPLGYNIGHGDGMHLGLEMITTDYVLIFDTDIVMKKPCIQEMLDVVQQDQNIYGCGWIIPEWKKGKWHRPMRYLHPWFKVISREQYFKHHRFVHHGAPCHKTYEEMSLNGAVEKLIDFPVSKYVTHLKRGTRDIKPQEFMRGWVH